MIEPPYPEPPRAGVLAAPAEDELTAAYRRLRGEALTLSWAAERLGVGVARLEALVRAGELVAIPGPWPMRQAHRSEHGCFLPGWQFGDGRPRPGVPAVVRAAADAGWTSLDLHLFMTTPLREGEAAPARLLRAGEVDSVVALIRGEPERRTVAPVPSPRRRRRPRAIRRPHSRRRRVAA
jgi:hypothetical protein